MPPSDARLLLERFGFAVYRRRLRVAGRAALDRLRRRGASAFLGGLAAFLLGHLADPAQVLLAPAVRQPARGAALPHLAATRFPLNPLPRPCHHRRPSSSPPPDSPPGARP